MKKCITTLASVIIAVCCSLAIAGQSNATSSAAVSNANASMRTWITWSCFLTGLIVLWKPSPATIYKNSGKSVTTVLKKPPPNAVLSSAGQKAQIVVLESIQVKRDEVRFHIHGLSLLELREVIVVIDVWDRPDDCYPGDPRIFYCG